MALTSLIHRRDHNHYESATSKDSFDGTYSTDSVIVTLSIALALYNSLELLLLVLSTFKRWRGLYFISLCVCNFGVFAYALGILLTYFDLSVRWFGKVVLDIGWVAMVACQSLVLYSRLNLILESITMLRGVKYMIITTSTVVLPVVVVLDFGSTYSGRSGFFEGYYYIEQIQLIVIGVQELVISGLYVWKAVALLKVLEKKQTRRVVWQLFAINVIIISMDIAIIALQFLHYQLYQEALKGFFYSVKLKLELNILSKLVDLVSGSAVNNRSNTLDVIDSNAIPGQATFMSGDSVLQREISSPAMKQQQPQLQDAGALGGWSPNGYTGKAILQEHIKEDDGGQIGDRERQHSNLGGLNATNVHDDDDDDEEEGITRMTSLSPQATYSSSRTRGRESDLWYADMLRSMK